MITLTKLANYFEDGLNKTLNNPEIQFRIWADAESLTFTPSEDCLAYVAGQAVKLTGGNAQTVELEPSAMQCNYENGVYEVYLITNKAVSISSASATYENILTGA